MPTQTNTTTSDAGDATTSTQTAPPSPANAPETPTSDTTASPRETPLFVANNQEELNAKFGKTRTEGRLSVAKEHGFDSLDAFNAAMKQYKTTQDAQKTDVQRLQEANQALTTTHQSQTAELRAIKLDREAERLALSAGASPDRLEAVLRLRNASDTEIDDTGNVSVPAITASVEAVLTSYPEFKKPAPTVGGGGAPAQAAATASSADEQIAEATKKNDWGAVIALQMHKLNTPT